ncbi:MAG: hypothetical protein LUE91_00985, partial [Oscillospiraceae bacterium]|nr:hypothetical protein [Oscillospiraceae bacterium]
MVVVCFNARPSAPGGPEKGAQRAIFFPFIVPQAPEKNKRSDSRAWESILPLNFQSKRNTRHLICCV